MCGLGLTISPVSPVHQQDSLGTSVTISPSLDAKEGHGRNACCQHVPRADIQSLRNPSTEEELGAAHGQRLLFSWLASLRVAEGHCRVPHPKRDSGGAPAGKRADCLAI